MLMRKLKKLGVALRVRHPLWDQVRATLSDQEWREEQAPFLPQISLDEIVGSTAEVQLIKPHFQGGNVSPEELLAITSLVAARKPILSLEIGTFDGNTTLQIAANAAVGGKVITLDLPLDDSPVPSQIALGDGQFIQSAARKQRRFLGSPWAKNIVEVFGDSMTFNFAAATDSTPVDLAFIDGSHSYEYVKSDTERLLPLLGGDAVVIWHDYCRSWTGVVKYLNELGRAMPLRHIRGTSVVYLDRRTI
jgi:predicted O-methyltransferase YrrM